MSEEKIKILDMLRDRKITTEEAMELLKQVSADDKRSYHHWRDEEPWPPRYRPDFGWITDLRDSIGETTRNVLYPDDFMYGTRRERFTSSVNSKNIRALVFEGKNAPIYLEACGGDKIEIEAYYKGKSRWSPHITLSEENDVFSLRYDDNALYLLGMNVRVPEMAQIGSVRLKNKNGAISVYNIEAEKIELTTKHESIAVRDAKGERLFIETKNAPIALEDVTMREIDAQTANAKITLDDVDAFRAQLMTNNAKIDIRNSDITQFYAKTSNSPLRFDNLRYKEQDIVRSIDAITTNGQISIRLPESEQKCRLRASTTVGGIFNELNDLEYHVNERNYIEAQARDYDEAPNKLNLNLQTTNYGIYIKQ